VYCDAGNKDDLVADKNAERGKVAATGKGGDVSTAQKRVRERNKRIKKAGSGADNRSRASTKTSESHAKSTWGNEKAQTNKKE